MSDPRQPVQPAEPIDLSEWEHEPIRSPARVQPHGVLMVLHGPDLKITQVSENIRDAIGVEPEEVLGKPIAYVVGENDIASIHGLLQTDIQKPLAIGNISVVIGNRPTYEALGHRVGDLMILELEPGEGDWPQQTLQTLMGAAMTHLRQTRDLQRICELTAEHAARITGFDRVFVLRFERSMNAVVLAERNAEGVEPWKGLHFPAADFPAPLRELYRENPLRMIPDTSYRPSPLTPAANTSVNESLDMSRAVLRDIRPMQLEFLRNLGAAASMSVALLVGNKVWGLIVCLHRTPRYLPYPVRTLCDLLAQLASVQIELHETESVADDLSRYRLAHAGLSEIMAQEFDILEAMVNRQPSLLDALDADGAATVGKGEIHLIGKSPGPEQLAELTQWLDRQGDPLFHTDRLGEVFPPARAYTDIASGLFTARLQSNPTTYLLWFRQERVRKVRWAGDPRRPVEIGPDGTIHPRRDFEPREETIRGTSDAWQPHELQACHELRISLQDVLSRRWRELEELQTLQRSNEALESFASIISHDLREPLAGIQIYLQLLEDDTRHLDEPSRKRVGICRRFATQASEMVTRLLHFSRASNVQLAFQPTDLNETVHNAIELVRPLIEQSRVDLRVPRALPKVVCDRSSISEVFVNLMTNAIKYNDKPNKWIEIGYVEVGDDRGATAVPGKPATVSHRAGPIIYVRDNGMGIEPIHHEMIFKMFSRVRPHDTTAGGTGVGLAIVKAIIERHRGKLWVESQPGEGTTFYFTLRAA